jgi:phosphate transport system protein
MNQQHIVKTFDDDLRKLNEIITRMGGLAETQLASAIRVVQEHDSDLALRVVEADAKVDDLEREADSFVVQLLALRQPMASDLRAIVAALKISSDLERIADYATNVAKRMVALAQSPQVRPAYGIPHMGRLALSMIKDVLDAYQALDAEKAVAVWESDEELDEAYNSLFRELLTYMMEDVRSISTCAHLLFMAKNIERIGDHATNIAENVYFMVHGEPLLDARPKSVDHSVAPKTPPAKE